MLEQVFDDGNICVQMRNLLVLFHVHFIFLPNLCLLDQVVTDPAATVIRATGDQIVFMCRFVCEEEKAQLRSLLMESFYLLPRSGSTVCKFGVQYSPLCLQN